MRYFLLRYCILSIIFYQAQAQLNLGSFNLFRNPRGDLQLGLGQGGSLFGYGADRALQVTIGPGRFGTKSDNGVILGGERVGLDQQLGVSENEGLNLGSLLQLGNNGYGGDPLGSMLRNVGSLLRLPPARGTGRGGLPSGPPLPAPSGEVPLSVGRGWDGDEGVEPASSGSNTRSSGSGKVPSTSDETSVEEVPGPLTAQRVVGPSVRPPAVQPPARPASRITTEGSRGDGLSSGGGEKNEGNGRHDGGTGQFERKEKLPIPDGLEMISAVSGESRHHA